MSWGGGVVGYVPADVAAGAEKIAVGGGVRRIFGIIVCFGGLD